MLAQRPRRWTNVKTTLWRHIHSNTGFRVVLTVILALSQPHSHRHTTRHSNYHTVLIVPSLTLICRQSVSIEQPNGGIQ